MTGLNHRPSDDLIDYLIINLTLLSSLWTILSHEAATMNYIQRNISELACKPVKRDILKRPPLAARILSSLCAHTWSTLMLAHDWDMSFLFLPFTPLAFKHFKRFQEMSKKCFRREGKREKKIPRMKNARSMENAKRPYKGRVEFLNWVVNLWSKQFSEQIRMFIVCSHMEISRAAIEPESAMRSSWDVNFHCSTLQPADRFRFHSVNSMFTRDIVEQANESFFEAEPDRRS